MPKKTVETKKASGNNSSRVKPTTNEDLYLLLDGVKYQLNSQTSPIYDCKEYFWKGKFEKNQQVKFIHSDGNEVPVHHPYNCGYTLIGKAQNFFSARKSLCSKSEGSDDREYIYITKHSTLSYTGESGVHTIYLRVYDNIYNENNDRWVVLYID